MTDTPQVSMDAVAAAAGVATSTVSRALKGDRRISATTQERIRGIAERMGYRPNPLVSALMVHLRHGHPPAARCNLAWLDFYPGPDDWQKDPVHRAFYAGAASRAEALGYALNRIQVGCKQAPSLARTLRNRGIQGVLLPAFEGSAGCATNIPLPLDQFTIVGVGTRFEKPLLHYSSDDQYECGRLAVQRLWQMGYRRIGYVGEKRVEQIVNGRFLAGYFSTLQSELGGKALPQLLTDRDEEAIGWLRRVKPQAILTSNRRQLTVLRSAAIRVPEDVALAHLNVEDVENAVPGEVAGVRQDNAGVGSTAVELLINLLYQNEVGVPLHPKSVQVHGTWVDGATARPRRHT
jgi:DNA-binding LacI/PurR family transcriptional regulator